MPKKNLSVRYTGRHCEWSNMSKIGWCQVDYNENIENNQHYTIQDNVKHTWDMQIMHWTSSVQDWLC